MDDLKIGDVVMLKAGGPKMTIYAIGNDVSCKWFDGNDLKYGGFEKEELVKLE
ncbi:DUF2158 domain-containing protein [Winogradskyella jejuensis]|uniref:Uncharacterized conserved protein YodC, DUF2158 family n=1 Tax=Winogradskyella jejuensis TaxID=1089305 RepID=A0A1M5UAP5_9FLAO|nr:DUF2158 domain-containing protein [Winogradskyella jejuensis]SHH60092.1 Uncharacterized conserved protein YodC, DUF2158 family [Winogradskyella jejuensis]